jgi:hypothetical protein
MATRITEEQMRDTISRADWHEMTFDHITTRHGKTINYYAKNKDGTWDNYNCRTI